MDYVQTFLPRVWFLILGFIVLTACGKNNGKAIILNPGPNAQTEVQNALIEANDGDVIEFEAGTFEFDRTLTMDGKNNITLQGRGREQTIFSFGGQTTGGDGLLITNSGDIRVTGFTIRDARGDALKFKDSDSITIFKVATVWSGEPSEENGSYGIYPVLCRNVLIDDCYAFGASDAGIYVGQSDKAIVKNSTAEGNVAGIEIENTTNADVFDNLVRDNTGGILVFDLPGLTQSGARTRVFNNTIRDNNRGNFAPEGGIVSQVPAGTGIMVLSTDQVEIFNNELEENNVAGTGVFSYQSLVALGQAPEPQDPEYDPYPKNIYIHDNTYSRSNSYAPQDKQSFFGNLLIQTFGNNPIPDIMLDGFFDPAADSTGSICIQNNSGSAFVNLNIPGDFPNNISFDAAPHNCSQEPLPPVELDVPEF